MNKDTDGLSLKLRFELVISKKAIERELKRVKKADILAETIKCSNQTKIDTIDHDEVDPCMNTSVYESVQCMICFQPPIYSSECKKCQKLMCS